MAGSPVRRARREALIRGEVIETKPQRGYVRELLEGDGYLESADQEQEPAQSDSESSPPQFARAPFRAGGPASADVRDLSDILPDLLTGAALGTSALVELIRQGAISPRDLAVTTSILIDKAHKLRDLAPEPTTGAADLEREAETVAALAAELKRRGE